jgi:hypothetical protein
MTTDKTDRTNTRWASVPGYSAQEVSTSGDVRYTGSLLPCRIAIHKGGRRTVGLVPDDGGRTVQVRVARAVLFAFVGGPPTSEKVYACHRNDVSTDDRLENLYWGSGSENGFDSVRNGRKSTRVCLANIDARYQKITYRPDAQPPVSLPKRRVEPNPQPASEALVLCQMNAVMRSSIILAEMLGSRANVDKWIEKLGREMRLVVAPARTPQGAAAC